MRIHPRRSDFGPLLVKLLLLAVYGVQAPAQGVFPGASAGGARSFEEGDNGGGRPPAGANHVTLTDYAKHKDGEDWAPAFERAFADGRTVHVPAGRYPCSRVRLSSGATIQGAGAETVFIPLDEHLFVIEGERGPEIRVAADIVDFSDVIPLQGDGGLAAGDEIMIRGQRNSMLREGTAGRNYSVDWVLGRTRKSSCFFGEMDVVRAVAGSTITTENPRIFPDYFQDDRREPTGLGAGFVRREATTVSKLSLVKNAALRNFSIEGTAKCYMPIRLRFCKDCLVEDITFTTSVESYDRKGKPDLSLVYGIYAWNTTVRDFRARLSPGLLAILDAKEKVYANFSNYNLFKMVSSTRSGFEGCEANGGTHAFSITRSASASSGGGIPSVDCFVRDCVASNCIWSGVKVQQGCYNTEVRGNTVTSSGQGIVTCGRRTTIVDNRVDTDLPHSTSYYYTHPSRGGTFGIGLIEGYACGSIVKGNVVSDFYSGIAFVDGYEAKNCFEEGDILIEGNTVTGCLRGFSLYKNPHGASLGRNPLNIKILDNTFAREGDHAVEVGPDGRETCGVYLPNHTAGVEIRSNTFRNFGHGVWMGESVVSIEIRGNLFADSGCGVTLAAAPPGSDAEAARIREAGNTFAGTAPRSRGLAQDHVSPY